ncbi:hypothetical protein A6P39_009960 [Streptomyces sp. FXJ1.172]|nr:hypothetical protein [Streptomyces sp. FXJ1.172]WEO94305.1 hypothetical protein A6P39_009960 [Streptomyces sp. FXJ1.172]
MTLKMPGAAGSPFEVVFILLSLAGLLPPVRVFFPRLTTTG